MNSYLHNMLYIVGALYHNQKQRQALDFKRKSDRKKSWIFAFLVSSDRNLSKPKSKYPGLFFIFFILFLNRIVGSFA